MPMRSKAQRRFLHATNPKVAADFERETPRGKHLPERSGDKADGDDGDGGARSGKRKKSRRRR